MIYLTAQTPIRVANERADFRKGIDGFVALCQHELNQDPRSGTMYVFLNRSATMIRVLVYDSQGPGYWLMTKRLSKGRYRGWPSGTSPISALKAHQLRQLLAGELNCRDD